MSELHSSAVKFKRSVGDSVVSTSDSDQSLIKRTLKNSFSGTIAGIAGCIIGHPFDTLKVRLQTQPVHNPVYKGLADCFIKTLKWEGIGGLYEGVGSPIVGQMFFRAVLFTSYYQFSALLTKPEHAGQRLSTRDYFVAGGMTGFVASFAESPIDLFKTKMQIQIIQSKSGAPVLYKNVFHAGWIIVKTHGIRGMYQGLSATWLRDTPSCAVYFGLYEYIRDYFTPVGGSVNDLKFWQLFIAGGSAGWCYWFFTYPTDVIKSSMQSDASDRSQRKFSGIFDCAKKLYLNEGGWRRFYRGYIPCLMRSIPANAAMLIVVDKCRQLLP